MTLLTHVYMHHVVDLTCTDNNERRKAHTVLAMLKPEELITGLMTVETKRRLEARSPKVTKVLPQQVAEVYGQLSRMEVIKVATYEDTKDDRYVLYQSDSVHFRSCMASGIHDGCKGCHHDEFIDGELDMYHQGHMHIAYLGKPWHVDGKGYIARAKLRVVYDNREDMNVLGCYIENVYGDSALFHASRESLRAWVKQRYGDHTDIYDLDRGNGRLCYVPSFGRGYDDSTCSADARLSPDIQPQKLDALYSSFKTVSTVRRYYSPDVSFRAGLMLDKGFLLTTKHPGYGRKTRYRVASGLNKNNREHLAREGHALLTKCGFKRRTTKQGTVYSIDGIDVDVFISREYVYGVFDDDVERCTIVRINDDEVLLSDHGVFVSLHVSEDLVKVGFSGTEEVR